MTTRHKRGEGCTLEDLLESLEKGKIGHTRAMEWLGIESLNELCDIMYANGRVMLGHQDMIVAPETRELLRAITKPLKDRTTIELLDVSAPITTP
jgi:hypothetical protein